MKRNTLRSLRSFGQGVLPKTASCRYSSLAERLHPELTSRQLPLTYDYLHPQPSHLLNLSLCDLLPELQWWPNNGATLPSINDQSPMPAGHHLVYFPPQVTLSQLLPDGTDILHSPGDPFNRRMWAGGKMRFPTTDGGPMLNGSRAACIETIRNVVVKGREGEEKVIVAIERRVGAVGEDESPEDIKGRIWTENEDEIGQASVIETRNLIFMREKTREQVRDDKAQFGKNDRFVRPPSDPEFCYKMTPTKSLLFRFSALTFNAHSIHLDQSYTRDVEGFRNLLVHGPLTLTLLLTVLQAHLAKSNRVIKEIDYRNLAPLYVEEELSICSKPKIGKDADNTLDVWIEGKDGGLAVRGTLKAGPV